MKANRHSRALAFILILTAVITLSGCYSSYSLNSDAKSAKIANLEENKWHNLGEGLDYFALNQNPYFIHVIKLNPQKYQFTIEENSNFKSAKSIKEIHQEKKSTLTFNGSFFDEKFQALGLLISNNKKLHNHKISGLSNGIFSIKNTQPELLSLSQFQKLSPQQISEIEFAIQNGPILLDQQGINQIQKDTGKLASRTAIGIDSKNNVIIIFLRQTFFEPENQISLYEFAKLLSENENIKDLGLHSVLNLDGGPSTGFALQNYYFPELDHIQNLIITKPRK